MICKPDTGHRNSEVPTCKLVVIVVPLVITVNTALHLHDHTQVTVIASGTTVSAGGGGAGAKEGMMERGGEWGGCDNSPRTQAVTHFGETTWHLQLPLPIQCMIQMQTKHGRMGKVSQPQQGQGRDELRTVLRRYPLTGAPWQSRRLPQPQLPGQGRQRTCAQPSKHSQYSVQTANTPHAGAASGGSVSHIFCLQCCCDFI